MYCVYNATLATTSWAALGWPLESNYGYFCDRRDNDYIFMASGPAKMVMAVCSYLLLVLYFGPMMMVNRKPLQIKNIIRIYNFSMVILNMYIIQRAIHLIDYGRSFFSCQAVELDFTNVDEIILLSDQFILTRIADFLDTIFFILRKKQTHVSFLHVFHHSYVPLVVYIATRYTTVVPMCMAFPFVNCCVHIIMYIYYLMATYDTLKPLLWWKRYLTALQITQFILMLIYNIYGAIYFQTVCNKGQIPALVGSLITAVIFLVLFNSFYKKAYAPSTTTTTNMIKSDKQKIKDK